MNILIVDDEEYARDAIATCIEWNEIGINYVFQASNGEEALSLVEKEHIDIVLSDIVMPFMNGLELAKVLYNSYPNIKVVIISGHDEFEYAKKSLEVGVVSYILKPVGAVTLKSKISRLCEKIIMEKKKVDYFAQMKHRLYESMPYIQDKLLNLLIDEKSQDIHRLVKRCTSYDIPIEATTYLVVSVKVEIQDINDGEVELYTFAVKNIIKETLGNSHYVFDTGDDIVILFRFFEDVSQCEEIVTASLLVVQKAVIRFMETQLTFGIGSSVSSYEDVYKSYNESCLAMACRYPLGKCHIYNINDLGYVEKKFYYPKDEFNQFIHSIKYMTKDDIELSLDKICDSMSLKKLSIANVKMVFIEITTALFKEFNSVVNSNENLWQDGFEVFNKIETMNTVNEIRNRILAYSFSVAKELSDLQINSNTEVINKSKEYMMQHYMDEELSLVNIAEKVSVSAGYLSALFKKETGINYIKYLTNIRMDKAIELVSTSDMKSYEIATAVGFANPHYFSKAFKKRTGYTPMSYRSIKKMKDSI